MSVEIERQKPRPAVEPISEIIVRGVGRNIIVTFRVFDGRVCATDADGAWVSLAPADTMRLVHAIVEMDHQLTGTTICLP